MGDSISRATKNNRTGRFGVALALLTSLLLPIASVTAAPGSVIVAPDAKLRSATHYYDIVATRFPLTFLNDSGTSGPFELLDHDRFLFVSRCGLVTVTKLGQEGMAVETQFPLPNVNQIFCAGASTRKDVLSAIHFPLAYGIKGMAIDIERKRLFIDTHSLEDGHCLVVKVFEYPIELAPVHIGAGKEIFSTTKQIPGIENQTGSETANRVRGYLGKKIRNTFGCARIDSLVPTQAGGAMTLDTDGNLYISVGDFGAFAAPQDKDAPFGKVFKYDGTRTRMFAMGLRNSEGIYFDPKSRHIYATEHGPKGGDEINEISDGDNLGWPISTYGVNYDVVGDAYLHPKAGDVTEKWGRHDFGKKPIFVYIPAIAPTDITVVSPTSMFRDWQGSLLLSSLRGNSIFRVLVEDGRAIYSEPIINLKSRIRYLKQGPDGTLYAKSDPDSLFMIQLDWPGIRRNDPKIDAELPILEKVAACTACHRAHDPNGSIPNINGLSAAGLAGELRRFRSATTDDSPMRSIALKLSDDEIDRLSEYFSKH